MQAYIGIDVAVAKNKYLPIVISTFIGGRLIPRRLRRLAASPPRGAGNIGVLDRAWRIAFARATRYYILQVCESLGCVPARIAIDAPSAPCSPELQRRLAETTLDKAGISCFATPGVVGFEAMQQKAKDHLAAEGSEASIPRANQLWMLAGFALFEELSKVAECIEVFPQATIQMAGAGEEHKSVPGAVEKQLAAISRHTGWPAGCSSEPTLNEIAWAPPRHDCLDAYLCSWVASLSENERIAFGRPPQDVIWVPRLAETQPTFEPVISTGFEAPSFAPTPAARLPRASSSTAAFLCPACRIHEFRRWPWGWDAHAAHKCSGLEQTQPTARKAEFRQKYAQYFKA